MPQIKDITADVLAVLEANRPTPMALNGIGRVLKQGGRFASQQQLKRALGSLREDGTVLEMLGGKIPWTFKNKNGLSLFYLFPEDYTAQRNEISDLAAQGADIELRRRHGKEWNEIYKDQLRYHEWKRK